MNSNFKAALEAGYLQPVLLPDGKHFELDGDKYYEPTEQGAKMAIFRFHSALDIIRMHEELRLDYHLNKNGWLQVKDKAMQIISSGDIEQIREAALDLLGLQGRIEARMEFGKDIEQIYQLTAIYFLIESEDPGSINNDIISTKISKFKSYPELYGFFLGLPLSRLAGSSMASDSATLSYLRELKQLDLLELRRYLITSQIRGVENATTNYISSQMETLSASVLLLDSLSRNTTTQSPVL